VPQTRITSDLVKDLLKDQKIFHAEVVAHENVTIEQLIDCINAKHRAYIPCLYVYNKIDQLVLEEVNRIAHLPSTLVISSTLNLNLDYLLEKIWDTLNLIRIYTKKKGEKQNIEG